MSTRSYRVSRREIVGGVPPTEKRLAASLPPKNCGPPPPIEKLSPYREAASTRAPSAIADYIAELEARERAQAGSARPQIVWTPQAGPQEKFKLSTAYELLYGGAAGGGKTWALAHECLEYALLGGRSLYLRRSFPELQEVIDILLPKISELGGIWKENKKRVEFTNGGVLHFGYGSTYREVLQYLSQQFGLIAYDQLELVAEERVWTFLMSRNRGTNRLPKKMRASANPGGVGHHWLKRRFINNCLPDGAVYTYDLPGGGTSSRAFIQSFLSDNRALMEADPEYAKRLDQLPDLERKWYKEGDWSAGAGMALTELSRERHLISAFPIPQHWRWFGAHDWGYNHPFSFGFFVADEDGNVFLVETVAGRKLQPNEIAARIVETGKRLGAPAELDYIVAGHDILQDHKARGESTPTIQEQYYELGLRMEKANISRVAGLQNLRRYLRWKDADGAEHQPRLRIFRTTSNLEGFDCLESRVNDPTHLEDILKTDADDKGRGGDDFYDMVRYGLASRPLASASEPVPPRITHPELQDPNEIFLPGADTDGDAPFGQLSHGF